MSSSTPLDIFFDSIEPCTLYEGYDWLLSEKAHEKYTLENGIEPLIQCLQDHLRELGRSSNQAPLPKLSTLLFRLHLEHTDRPYREVYREHRENLFFAVIAVSAAIESLTHLSGTTQTDEEDDSQWTDLVSTFLYLKGSTQGKHHLSIIGNPASQEIIKSFQNDVREYYDMALADPKSDNFTSSPQLTRSLDLFEKLQDQWMSTTRDTADCESRFYISQPEFLLALARRLVGSHSFLDTQPTVRVPFAVVANHGYSYAFVLRAYSDVNQETVQADSKPIVVLDPESSHLYLEDGTSSSPDSQDDHFGSFVQVLDRVPIAVFNQLTANSNEWKRALSYRWALGIERLTPDDGVYHQSLAGSSVTMAAATAFAKAWHGYAHDRIAILAECVSQDDPRNGGVVAKEVKNITAKVKALIKDIDIDTIMVHPDNAREAQAVCDEIRGDSGLKAAVVLIDPSNPLGLNKQLAST